MLVGQVFRAQPFPAGVVTAEFGAGLGICDDAGLGGGGQQDARAHQNVVDVAVSETAGVFLVDRHHGLVDADTVGGAVLARQAPEGVGGTNGTITTGIARNLPHDGLGRRSAGLGRGAGSGDGLCQRLGIDGGRSRLVRAFELNKKGLPRRVFGLGHAQQTQCE